MLDAPDGRGGSRFIHEQVEVGTHIRVRGPRNHFALQPSARYLFIAGGIGITPILPMIAEAEARGANGGCCTAAAARVRWPSRPSWPALVTG